MLNRITLIFLITFFASSAFGDIEIIKSKLMQKFPNINIKSIVMIDGADLYELVIDDQIYYVDKQSKYLIDGSLIRMEDMKNLTSSRKQEIEAKELERLAINFEEIPKSYAILKTTGNGEKKLAYFADPNCGYCKRFEKNVLSNINNLSLYIYMYPIIAQESVDITKRIWCSEDKIQSWDDYVLNGIIPKNEITNCNNPIEKIMSFGEKLKIRGTPTLFFENGKRVPGAISASQLEEMLTNN